MTKEEILEVVQTIFSEKEESDRKVATEKALDAAQKVVETLTESIEAKDSEIAELSAKLEKAATPCDHESKITELESKITEADKRAALAESKLEGLSKLSVATVRVDELVAEGLVTSKEKALNDVINLSEESYTSFKDMLVGIKTNILESLKSMVKPDAVSTESADTKVTPVETPAADLSAGKETAAINSETETTSVQDKYKAAGKAMAERIAAKRNKTK